MVQVDLNHSQIHKYSLNELNSGPSRTEPFFYLNIHAFSKRKHRFVLILEKKDSLHY